MSLIARPVITRRGNKERLIPYLLQVFPPDMNQYTDPFGGSGAVLLALPPNPNRLDIYNDLDSDLVNFILCLKERPNELMRELGFLPIHSREIFELYRDFLAHKDITMQNIRTELECLEDRSCFTEEQARKLRPTIQKRAELYDVQRAAAFFYTFRGSYSSTGTSFGVKAYDAASFLHLIPSAAKRLKDVVVENKDALRLIRARDRPGGLIYNDPPYFDAEDSYPVSRGKRRRFHIRLWQVLSCCQGYVVVSCNDCPFIRQLYRNFYILAFRRNHPLMRKKGAEYGELIMTNYDPRRYLTQLTLFDLDTYVGEYEMELVNVPKIN